MTKLTIFKQSVLDFKGNCSIVIPNKFTPFFFLMNCISLLAGYRGALSSLSGSSTLSTVVTTHAYRAVLQWLHQLLGSLSETEGLPVQRNPLGLHPIHACFLDRHVQMGLMEPLLPGRVSMCLEELSFRLKILYFRFVQENKIFTVQIFRDLPSKFVVLLQTGNKPY